MKALGWSMLTAWPAAGITTFAASGNLCRHVIGGGEEWRVIGADHDQGGHLDIRQRFDHPGVALGQHAAGGARQSRGVAMADTGAFAAGRLQHREAFALKTVAGLKRALVPGLAGLVFLETRAGIDDQQRADPLRMRAIKCQRHVAAERKPADDGAGGADLVEQRGHVGHCRAPRCRRWNRRDSPSGRGRACPTAPVCAASTAPRSGPATSRRSMNSRGSAGQADRRRGLRSRCRSRRG